MYSHSGLSICQPINQIKVDVYKRQVWHRLRKTVFVGLETLKLGVTAAVLTRGLLVKQTFLKDKA